MRNHRKAQVLPPIGWTEPGPIMGLPDVVEKWGSSAWQAWVDAGGTLPLSAALAPATPSSTSDDWRLL